MSSPSPSLVSTEPPPVYEERRVDSSADSEKQEVTIEKRSNVSTKASNDDLTNVDVKEVEAIAERLANDEAHDDEYRVQEAYEVALKASTLSALLPP